MNGRLSAAVVREARSDDAAAIARVHVDTWRTTYRAIMPAEFLAGLSYENRERQWTRALGDPEANFIFVAEDSSGAVVGLPVL